MSRNLLFLLFALATAVQLSAQNVKLGKLYTVTTMEQFMQVLGPDRTIELAADFFFLPKDMVGGLVLDDVDNLTLMGEQGRNVRFVTPNPEVSTLHFKNCENVRLENLELGHAPEHATTCDGHVVSFSYCKKIEIVDCFLFGSGFLGLSAEYVQDLRCEGMTIRGCTGRILTLMNCRNVEFNHCIFTDNVGSNEMLGITDSKDVSLLGCEISLNRMNYDELTDMMTGYPIFAVRNSKKVKAKGCAIVGNSTPFLFLTPDGIELDRDCEIHSNFVSVKDYKQK